MKKWEICRSIITGENAKDSVAIYGNVEKIAVWFNWLG